MSLRSLLYALLPTLALAFTAPSKISVSSSTSLYASLPKFDKAQNKWVATSPDQEAQNGYDAVGTLLRQGPQPFFIRVFKPDDYEQAVLKFMAGDKVDRNMAQAEMDAYLRNANDWAYNRMKGYKTDYLSLQPKKIALTLVWSALILSILGRGVYCVETGENFWAIFGLSSKVADCAQFGDCVFQTE
mmetsp:Transcript_36589/g.51735  ORF Transcript_36589/g.51735 Transcript_36589/m.51735 type:complete len:187 (+) Transcript_36589:2-562(+)